MDSKAGGRWTKFFLAFVCAVVLGVSCAIGDGAVFNQLGSVPLARVGPYWFLGSLTVLILARWVDH